MLLAQRTIYSIDLGSGREIGNSIGVSMGKGKGWAGERKGKASV